MRFAGSRGWRCALGAIGVALAVAAAPAPAVPAPALPPGPLDLPTAIRFARAHNRALALGARQAEAGGVERADADAAFAPRILPDSSVAATEDGTEWQYGLGVARKRSLGTELQAGGRLARLNAGAGGAYERAVLAVELRQPLFRNFGTLVQGEPRRLADSRARGARRAFYRLEADLVVDVVDAFERVLRADRQWRFDRNQFERMDKLHRLTVARERQGHASRVDTLRVALQRSEAETRLAADRGERALARQAFAELLGAEPGAETRLVPPPLLEVADRSPEEAVAVAYKNRLDFAQALQDLADRRRGVRIAERRRLPDLSLVTRYERTGEGDGTDEAVAFDKEGWYVGLVAAAPFEPARDAASLARSRADAATADAVLRVVELAIARQVRDELARYRQARAELGLAERNVELAGQRARLARRLFDAGRGDSFSVTDAESALVGAETGRLEARSAAAAAGYRLLRVLGTLVACPEELKPSLAMTSE